MKLVCQIIGHRRSAGHAKFDYQTQLWRSVCRYCEEPLVRLHPRRWRPETEPDPRR